MFYNIKLKKKLYQLKYFSWRIYVREILTAEETKKKNKNWKLYVKS